MTAGSIPNGNDKKLAIRCSRETFEEFVKMDSELTPEGTYEDTLHIVLQEWQSNPLRFKNKSPSQSPSQSR